MRGGLERWKRGVGSQGVRQAIGYAFHGSCDSHLRSAGAEAVAAYGDVDHGAVSRFTVERGVISSDMLDEVALRRWVDGRDPETDEVRGRDLSSPDADLILDGTINAPKSYSIAALINADLAREFEALQDRLRDRIILTWQRELNARRGAGGRFREPLRRVEVVELQHRRSRALDPHIHRHLWLNVKVLGVDGKWSNVDSRVAMQLHTLINAEGDLAARTDPQWRRALALNGFTLDADGEITELAHAVRPLSRRSTQIEANRAMLLATWQAERPGQQPSPDQLHRIDRLAWATARPNKPGEVDEVAWEQLIAGELAAIDPATLHPRREVPVCAPTVEDLDLGLLAAQATVEADARSTSCGGRFSVVDVRAGAARALAGCGIVAPRADLDEVIDEITHRALALTVDLLPDEADRPIHVKAYMAAAVAALKVELATRYDALTCDGASVDSESILAAAGEELGDAVELDEHQVAAAAAIAGTDRLVSVTGPAGAGKTTMLRVARIALFRQGRRMVVVAPTKKAATVAGRELGTAASSLHALLADHGFRWSHDAAGAEAWTRLVPGDIDPTAGIVYAGPRRFPLTGGDRVVVDEAGMVDLHTANALATIAGETGAGIAMVGDHLQARPVGHSGAMAAMTRRATAVIELAAVHRFRNPDYAALTLRMREPASKEAALAVAAELAERDLIHKVDNLVDAREVMVEAYFRWTARHARVALVTGTNEEADAINETIQQRRLEKGQLALTRIAVGQGEQRLLEGDIVQTRRNDRQSDVENRALWKIHRITASDVELASVTDSGDRRTVSHDYAAQHVHLAYASTVHGIQGETTDASIVGPGVDAAGLYVGMTRGRARNEVIAVAHTDATAKERIAESMLRGIPEVSLDDAIHAARNELGRAARAPAGRPYQQAPWTDRTNRPLGHELDIDRLATRQRERDRGLREEIRDTRAWLTRAQSALFDLDARIAADNAAHHGRNGQPDRGLITRRTQLLDRYEARSADYAELTEAQQQQAYLLQQAEAERRVRLTLDDRARRAEDAARHTRAASPIVGSSPLRGGLTR